MKKYLLCALIITSLLFPSMFVKADDMSDSFEGQLASRKVEILSQTTKYYKNVAVYNTTDYQTYSLNSENQPIRAVSSETVEVSAEEYFSIDPETFQSVTINSYTTIETTYMTLTTSIGSDGQYFHYGNTFSYLIIPSVRSYDVIGIGYNNNVKPVDGTTFCTLYYGYPGGGNHIRSSYIQNFSNGSSCMLDLPNSSDINNINIQFDFRVQKVNPNVTIPSQIAIGDYRHAEETVTLLQAMDHEVTEVSGIVFSSKYEDKFSMISLADCHWDQPW